MALATHPARPGRAGGVSKPAWPPVVGWGRYEQSRYPRPARPPGVPCAKLTARWWSRLKRDGCSSYLMPRDGWGRPSRDRHPAGEFASRADPRSEWPPIRPASSQNRDGRILDDENARRRPVDGHRAQPRMQSAHGRTLASLVSGDHHSSHPSSTASRAVTSRDVQRRGLSSVQARHQRRVGVHDTSLAQSRHPHHDVSVISC